MKSFKLFLTVLFLSVLGLGNVYGETATSSSLSSTSTSAQTVEDGKTITYTCSSSNSYSNPARIYKNSTFTISSTDEATITKIELTTPSGYPANALTADAGSYSATTTEGTWTGSATSVVFTASAQVRVSGITVTYSSTSLSVSVTGVSLNKTSTSIVEGETLDLTATVAPDNATNKAVTWTSSNEAVATVSNGKVTAVSAGSANITVTTTDGSKTATCAITVNAAAKHNVIWSVNGATTSEEVAEGADITFTTPTSIPDDVAFMGWAAGTITGTQDDAPTYVTSAKMGTEDVTYYAVFATASAGDSYWAETALANLTSSDVFVFSDGSYAMTNANGTGSAPSAVSITVSNSKITSEVTDAMKWNIGGNATDGYTFYPNGSKTTWLYCNTTASSGSNSCIRVGTGDRKLWVTSSNKLKTNDSYTARYISNYSNSDFRGYTSSSSAFVPKFYKLTSSITYSSYCTSVVVKTVSSIALSGTYPTEFWIGDTFKHDGVVVTATYTDASTEDVTANATFSGYNMANAGNQTITVSYKGQEKTYNITVKTIANTEATAYTTAEAKTLIDAGKDLATKVYVKGTISKIEKFNDTYGSITYWLDSDAFEIYGGLNNNGEKFTSIDDIKVGGEVIVYGEIKKYTSGSTTVYETNQNSWLVSYTAPAVEKTTATITLSTYKSSLAVDEAADEYTVTYNGDGTVSATSSDETVAEVIYDEGTVLVSALKAGMTTITVSAPATETYTNASKSYTLTVTAALTAAELPFNFDGGKADVDNHVSMREKGLNTTDYANSPKLKFDSQGDEVVVRIADAAKKVTYTLVGNSMDGTYEFSVLQSTNGKSYTSLASYTTLGEATAYSVNPAADTRYIKFVYTTKGTGGNVALGAIEIIAAGAKEDPTFSIADLTVNNGDNITPVITTNNTDAYTVSYVSNNEEVALASGNEIVTMGVGTATITATMAATENFNQAQTTFVVTVDPAGTTTATWVASDWATAESITTGTSLDDNKVIAADANVDMTWSKGTGTNTPFYAPADPGMRLYTSNTIKFASKNGKIISYIKFDLTANGNDVSANNGTYADGVWTGFANEVVISNGTGKDQMKFNTITIKYVDGTVTTLSIADMSMKPTDAAATIAVTSNKENPIVVYSGYDEAVCTIAEGKVTPVAVGETNVTATIAQEGSYTAATTTFKVTVAAKEVTTLSFPKTSYTVKSNETFTAPVLTVNPSTLTGITYSSSDEAVATVAADGAVTIKAVGTTIIKASFAETAQYEASEASYVLNVLDPNTDVITRASIGIDGANSYSAWAEDKTFASGTKYAGLSMAPTNAGQTECFALRGTKTDTYSGIVSTSTMGKVKKVTVKWSSAQTTARTLNIYGSNTAFTSVKDVTSLTAITTAASGSTPNEIDFSTLGDYAYIGIYPSTANACYIDEIDIEWTPVDYLKVAVAATANGTVTVDKTSCLEGAEVTITTEPAEHYELATLKVYKTGDEATEVTVTEGKFTMPAYNVTVAATFSAIAVVVPDGEQVAWVEKSGDKYYALATSASGSYMAAQEVTVINGKVVVADDDAKNAVMWVMTTTAEGTTFKTVYSEYLTGTSSTELKLGTTAYNWQKAADGHYYNGSRTPKFNGSSDFRNYSATSNSAVLMPIVMGYTRDMTNGYMGTHCYPFTIKAGDYVGATFYTPAYRLGTSKIYWDEVTGDIEAGKPYLIVPDGSSTFIAIKQADALADPVTVDYGMVGNFTAPYAMITANDGNYIVYENQFRLAGEYVAVGQYRAYIHLTAVTDHEVAPTPGRRRIVMNNADTQVATDVDNIENSAEASKVLINGHLFIICGEKIYDAAGRLVE